MEEVPVYPHAVVGYRMWQVDITSDPKMRLYGTGFNAGWEDGVETAVCCLPKKPGQKLRHPAPAKGCHCGIHGYYDLERANMHYKRQHRKQNLMIGAIAAKGDLRCTHYGFRCEQAQIVGLVRRSKKYPNADAAIARLYRAPLFDSVEELEAHVQTLGLEEVDEKLKPAKPPFWRNDEILGDYRRATVAMMALGLAVGMTGDHLNNLWAMALGIWILLMTIGIGAAARQIHVNACFWNEEGEPYQEQLRRDEERRTRQAMLDILEG